MKHLYPYILEEAGFSIKYTAIEFGFRIPFTQQRISWLIFINFLFFFSTIIIVPIFPHWFEATSFVNYDNWITHEPASNALTIGLIMVFTFMLGGVLTGDAQSKVKGIARKWYRENIDKKHLFSDQDKDMLMRMLGYN